MGQQKQGCPFVAFTELTNAFFTLFPKQKKKKNEQKTRG